MSTDDQLPDFAPNPGEKPTESPAATKTESPAASFLNILILAVPIALIVAGGMLAWGYFDLPKKLKHFTASKPVEVKGHVTWDGKPLAGAIVNSRRINRSNPLELFEGLTDKDGNFTLKYMDHDTGNWVDGAFPGNHEVTIQKREQIMVATFFLSPKKYSEFDTSGFTMEVTTDSSRIHEFVLEGPEPEDVQKLAKMKEKSKQGGGGMGGMMGGGKGGPGGGKGGPGGGKGGGFGGKGGGGFGKKGGGGFGKGGFGKGAGGRPMSETDSSKSDTSTEKKSDETPMTQDSQNQSPPQQPQKSPESTEKQPENKPETDQSTQNPAAEPPQPPSTQNAEPDAAK